MEACQNNRFLNTILHLPDWIEVESSGALELKKQSDSLQHNYFSYNIIDSESQTIIGQKHYLQPDSENEKKYLIKYENANSGMKLIKTNKYNCFHIFKDFGKYTEVSEDGRLYVNNRIYDYISLDGVNGIRLPNNTDTSHTWCTDDYLYIDANKSEIYRIPIKLLVQNVKVIYNDNCLSFETPPTTENDRTLVPMRFLFEQMGANVNWESSTKTATVERANEVIAFSIDNATAVVNNVEKTMDVPSRLVNDKTMIPLRFLSEELGYHVEWDEATKIITITN